MICSILVRFWACIDIPDGFNNVMIQCVSLLKGFVQRHFAKLTAHCRLSKLHDCINCILHPIGGSARIDDLQIGNTGFHNTFGNSGRLSIM